MGNGNGGSNIVGKGSAISMGLLLVLVPVIFFVATERAEVRGQVAVNTKAIATMNAKVAAIDAKMAEILSIIVDDHCPPCNERSKPGLSSGGG